MERFSRIKTLLGDERASWLAEKQVTVVGIGAVGGYAVEGLTRAGIKNLRLVDFDTVHLSNINRQIHALESTVGMIKVMAARDRVLDINPQCRVEPLSLFADPSSIDKILHPCPDLLIDAIDSLSSKIALLHSAWQQKIPTISSMGAALRTDPTLIRVDDLMETKKCPLARRLRKKLRQLGVGEGISCVYSMEDIDFDYGKPVPHSDKDCGSNRGRPRRVLGSLPTLTGIFGLTLANTALYRLLETFPPTRSAS